MSNPNWKALHANNLANESAVAEAEGKKKKMVLEPEIESEESCNKMLMPAGISAKPKQEDEEEHGKLK